MPNAPGTNAVHAGTECSVNASPSTRGKQTRLPERNAALPKLLTENSAPLCLYRSTVDAACHSGVPMMAAFTNSSSSARCNGLTAAMRCRSSVRSVALSTTGTPVPPTKRRRRCPGHLVVAGAGAGAQPVRRASPSFAPTRLHALGRGGGARSHGAVCREPIPRRRAGPFAHPYHLWGFGQRLSQTIQEP